MNFNIRGVDISAWNPSVDFNSLKANGVQYVYIKSTEGTTFKDPKMQQHYNGAKAAGLKIGFYHFLVGSSSPETQAENAYNTTKGLKQDLVFMLDVETAFSGLGNYVVRFINKWQQLSNVEIGIYTYSGFVSNLNSVSSSIKNRKVWIANYTSSYSNVKTGFFTNIVGWQNSDKAVIGSYKGDGDWFSQSVLNKASSAIVDGVYSPNDTITADCPIYFDNKEASSAGQLKKGNLVTVLEYFSDYSKLKSGSSFVYVETKYLKSRSEKYTEAESPLKSPNDSVTENCSIYSDNSGYNKLGELSKDDEVTVLRYYSDYSMLKSMDTFVYIETKYLKNKPSDSNNPAGPEDQDVEELKKKIEQLESENSKLKAELEEMKAQNKALQDKLDEIKKIIAG